MSKNHRGEQSHGHPAHRVQQARVERNQADGTGRKRGGIPGGIRQPRPKHPRKECGKSKVVDEVRVKVLAMGVFFCQGETQPEAEEQDQAGGLNCEGTELENGEHRRSRDL